MRIGLLVSGGLGLILLEKLKNECHLIFVFTDINSRSIIDFCKSNNIECFIGNPRMGKCASFITGKEIDVLVSVNYLFLIEQDVIELPKKYAFNIHGSLLPKYRGRTPHVWAIINGEENTGITAHLIDEGCDTGKILKQVNIPIENDDTGANILEKFAFAYPELVTDVLTQIEKGTISPITQDNTLATYYGKRTPEDGLINWDWCKERIYNWIRAQAPPYPGSFTFLGKSKITFVSSKFSNLGFNYDLRNGTVLALDPLTVKTNNGALELELANKEDLKLLTPALVLGN
ncbi:methionyl-tRNA formyltransferase [Sediminicola luteus]|uniref:Methionyl-tRNA formyltransferase n=1 Tax=Sediminicola luteus TaxID=319238 RepID=A0A2A4GD80_9FLAO|nr:methionyl-tRNA formyltransferase [Sediminicola luteus]PCE66557.1 hypothetical protein B7P33_04475 [Sediminicola luteus]